MSLPSHNDGVQNKGASPDMALLLILSVFANICGYTTPLKLLSETTCSLRKLGSNVIDSSPSSSPRCQI